ARQHRSRRRNRAQLLRFPARPHRKYVLLDTHRARSAMYRGRCSRSGTGLALPDVVARRAHVLSTVLVLGIVLSGCASTRIAEVGTLPNGERLITLVVTENRQVVHRQCQDVPALGPVLGCQTSRALALPNGVAVRAVKIVRYTDVLPS